MEKVVIRKVIETDNAVLASLIRNVFEEYDAPKQNTVYSDPTTNDLFRLFQQSRSVLFVALFDDKICGCCGIYQTEGLPENCAELAKFYLLKEARGKGIGKQLMLQCFQFAKETGYTSLYIESLPQFSTAVSMYEKYGFTRIDQPLGNSGHISCNIWMLKKLN
ncbi:MAG: GNAT family N-acetyltransferase [Parafilimonas sp.]|nr:GNAT family N-acetyltransferase [Parafilimonas sp.]